LKRLHSIFGKWYLAVMAYNCGEGRLKRALQRAKTDELTILLDHQAGYLPKETREYIQKILLVAMIGENEMIDFASGKAEEDFVRVDVAGGTDLEKLAVCIGMDPRQMRGLNRQFKKGKIPITKEYFTIMIPEEMMAVFYLQCNMEEKEKVFKPHLLSHIVKLGETLESIAKKYNSSAGEIKRANRMNDDSLVEGSILVIPISENDFEQRLKQE
jgi:membrane-bound lytic murein transglycosylase D